MFEYDDVNFFRHLLTQLSLIFERHVFISFFFHLITYVLRAFCGLDATYPLFNLVPCGSDMSTRESTLRGFWSLNIGKGVNYTLKLSVNNYRKKNVHIKLLNIVILCCNSESAYYMSLPLKTITWIFLIKLNGKRHRFIR